MVRVVLDSAKSGGKAVKRPWFGAKLQDVTPDIAESMGLKRPSGALVVSVVPGSPAAQAGLQTGAPIVFVAGQLHEVQNAVGYPLVNHPLCAHTQHALRPEDR